MSLEGFCWFVRTEFANMNALICRARSKTNVRLPVYVKSWSGMKTKLLRALASRSIPNNGSLFKKEKINIQLNKTL